MGPSSAFCWRFGASNFESIVGFGGAAPPTPFIFCTPCFYLCLDRFIFHTYVSPLTWSLFSPQMWEIFGLLRAMHAAHGFARMTALHTF